MFTPILDSSQRRPLYEQLYRYIRGDVSPPESACPPSGRWQPT